MSTKSHPMYVSDWLATCAAELVEHVRRHHTMTDISTWEQHIGELLQEEVDRVLMRDLPANTTPEQLRQVRDGVLVWRGDHWEMPPGDMSGMFWEGR